MILESGGILHSVNALLNYLACAFKGYIVDVSEFLWLTDGLFSASQKSTLFVLLSLFAESISQAKQGTFIITPTPLLFPASFINSPECRVHQELGMRCVGSCGGRAASVVRKQMLLLQRAKVWFPAPISDSSQSL